MTKLKPGIRIIRKGELRYLGKRRPMQFKPWLELLFLPVRFLMSKSVFPGKIGGDSKHYSVSPGNWQGSAGILELGTEAEARSTSSIATTILGTDISPGLLKRAAKRFLPSRLPGPGILRGSGTTAETSGFNLCLCILSLNFIGKVEKVFKVHRLLISGGMFVCSVPVPERNRL